MVVKAKFQDQIKCVKLTLSICWNTKKKEKSITINPML